MNRFDQFEQLTEELQHRCPIKTTMRLLVYARGFQKLEGKLVVLFEKYLQSKATSTRFL
jgi:hypothetical protein